MMMTNWQSCMASKFGSEFTLTGTSFDNMADADLLLFQDGQILISIDLKTSPFHFETMEQ